MNSTVERTLRLAWVAVPSVLAFVLVAVFLANAGSIRGPEAVYPIVLAVALLVLGLYNLARDEIEAAVAAGQPERGQAIGRTVAFSVVLIGSVLLLQPLGFFPAMAIMSIGNFLVFGVRKPLVILAGTALIVGFSYLIFVRLLVVPFPTGMFGLS